jgi:hypothetical protein
MSERSLFVSERSNEKSAAVHTARRNGLTTHEQAHAT